MAAKVTNYEKQAKLSAMLAAVGGVCALGAIGLIFKNFDFERHWVAYSARGKWIIALAGMLALALLSASAAAAMGFSTAGHKRNSMTRLSWLGFFGGALVIAIALSSAIFFYFMRYSVAPTTVAP